MKKTLVLSVSAMLLMSSCTTTGEGAVNGAMFGSIIGSAIGGITGGPRGSDIGTLIGMAGGAAAGAAVGNANERAERQKYEEYRAARRQRITQEAQPSDIYRTPYQPDVYEADSTGSGDDRLYGFDENLNSTGAGAAIGAPSAAQDPSVLEIRHARLIDATKDGNLSRGEEARMVFEIFNTGNKPVHRVLPTVTEVTGNKHIYISENVMVESILPGKGIRYTASIRGGSRLRDGEAVIRISVLLGNREATSQAQEFRITTSRR